MKETNIQVNIKFDDKARVNRSAILALVAEGIEHQLGVVDWEKRTPKDFAERLRIKKVKVSSGPMFIEVKPKS